MALPTLKYSKNKVNKVGKFLVNYLINKPDHIDRRELLNSFQVLNNWRSCHAIPINTFQATLRTKLKSIDSKALVAQRLKRLPSIILKLNRFEKMQLARMQDIGGLRAVVSTLKHAQKLENNYKKSHFKHELYTFRDYIQNPKPSGYRSIHLVYKYNSKYFPEYNGLFVELQIRTKLQHAWATAVETMGTYLEHALKSSEGPEEWLDFFSLVGSAFSYLEGTPPVSKYNNLTEEETYESVIRDADKLGVKNKLLTFGVVTQSTDSKKGTYHLIVLDFKDKKVNITSYTKNDLKKANKDYAKVERQLSEGEDRQAVLVSAGSILRLRQAYPNYFLDTHEFIKKLTHIKTKATKMRNKRKVKQNSSS